MGTSEIHFGGLLKNTSSFLFILAWREKQCFQKKKKILKTSLDKNKTNKQESNKITKSDCIKKF